MAQVSSDGKLYRANDAWLGGVCACLARRLDLDPLIVRIMAVAITFLTLGVGALVYLVMWALLPRESEDADLYDVHPEQAESSAFGLIDVNSPALKSVGSPSGLSVASRLAIAVSLMLLFLAISMGAAPMVSGSHWWQFWPLAWVICGLCLIIVPVRSRHEVSWHALGIVITSLAAASLPMSLGIVSWDSFAQAFQRMWFLVAIAIVLFAVGTRRTNNALVIAGALIMACFFLMVLALCAVPGDVNSLVLNMPGGYSMSISMA